MIALKGYEKFLLSSLDQLLEGNDGSVKPDNVQSKLNELDKIAKSMELYKSGNEFLLKDHLLKFNLARRSRNGELQALEMIHCSSGSSSKSGPTYWGRDTCEELAVAVRFEQIFRDHFMAHEKITLAVNCFPMGSWVGGVFTAFCTRSLSQKGYLISQITPGNNPEEIIRISGNLFSLFDQAVLLGYPPFIKMIIDNGNSISKDYWKGYNLKFVFAGEVFSEEWRSLLAGRSYVQELERDIVSIYGTADAGVLATETVLSVYLRQYFASNPSISRRIFKKDRIPSLMQYDPLTRYLEVKGDDQTLVVSGLPWNLRDESDKEAAKRLALPLLKYALGDDGGIMDFEDMINLAKSHDASDFTNIKKISDLIESGRGYRKLPFVWVFGRKFWTVSIYGANVYVENVMVDDPEDCRLLIRIELVDSPIPENFAGICAITIRDQIKRLNSEYSNYVPAERAIPLTILHPLGDLPYFRKGVKHQYVQN